MATAAVHTPAIEPKDYIGAKFTTRTVTVDSEFVTCGVDLQVELTVHEDSTGQFTVPEITIRGKGLANTGNGIEDGALFGIRSTETLRVLSRMLAEVADLADDKGLIPDRDLIGWQD